MNKLINFELAKMLKESGFDLMVNYYFADNGREERHQPLYPQNYNGALEVGLKHSRPTIAEVVMWLWEKHKIWIMVDLTGLTFYPRGRMIDENGKHWAGDFKIDGERINCTNPHEAYEYAIKYCLTILVKQ